MTMSQAYNKKTSIVLDEITNFCNEECASKTNCPEDECILYRIEKIIEEPQITKCECCWEDIEGEQFELDGLTMCQKCFEYHGGEKNGQ